MRTAAWVAGIILAAIIIFVGIRLVNTGLGVVDKTVTADNAIQNYEWFKQQYESYLAINAKIEGADNAVKVYTATLPADREKWTSTDKNELARLQTIADGLRFQRADIAAQYNARSKMANRALFKDHNLPETLPQ